MVGPLYGENKRLRPHPPFEELERDIKSMNTDELLRKYKTGLATLERWRGELELYKTREKK